MPKMKTHKGAKKRLRVTAGGKVRYKRTNTGHLMSGKSGDRCRSLRKLSVLGGSIGKRVRIALGKA